MSDAAAAPVQVKTPAKKAAKPKKPAKLYPKYNVMIAAAVTSLKERGGSSRQAILKCLLANYKVGSEVIKVNARLKSALKAGVKAGTLKQAKGTGASGSFRLGEKKVAAKAKKPKAAAKKPKKAKSPKKAAKPKTAKPQKAKTPKKAAAKSKKAAKSPAKKAAKPKKAKTPRRLLPRNPPRSERLPKRDRHLVAQS